MAVRDRPWVPGLRCWSPGPPRVSARRRPSGWPLGGATVALVARRADRLDRWLADCRAAGGAATVFACRPRRPGVGGGLGRSVWDRLGPRRRHRQQRRHPHAPPRRPAHHGGSDPGDDGQFLLPGVPHAGPASPTAGAGAGHHRQRVEPGRPARHHQRGGLQRIQVRPRRVERVAGRRSVRDRGVWSGSSCPGPSIPRSGTNPDNDPADYDGPSGPGRRGRRGDRRLHHRATASSTTFPTCGPWWR